MGQSIFADPYRSQIALAELLAIAMLAARDGDDDRLTEALADLSYVLEQRAGCSREVPGDSGALALPWRD